MIRKPVLGSCLSGIGGIDLGFHYAEWEIGWQVERDPYKQLVLRCMWPNVKRHPDLYALNGFELSPVDCITIDCPSHRYRDDRVLIESALKLIEPWRPEFFVICLPCAIQFRDEGVDWTPLLDGLKAYGYLVDSIQCSVGHGSFWWERAFIIGHRRPFVGRLQQVTGTRALFHDAEDKQERPFMCHGCLDHGDIGGGERNLAFPRGWTCICTDWVAPIPCTPEARVSALRQSTCVDVSAWLASLLLEELKLHAGEVLTVVSQ